MISINVLHALDGNAVTFCSEEYLSTLVGTPLSLPREVQYFRAREKKCVSLEQGLQKIYNYGTDKENGTDMSKWDECVSLFKKEVNGRAGKYYLWNVEFDLRLMFVGSEE